MIANTWCSVKPCVELLQSQTLCSCDNCSELFCSLLCSDLNFSGSSNHVWYSLYAMFLVFLINGFGDLLMGKGKSWVVNCLFCFLF